MMSQKQGWNRRTQVASYSELQRSAAMIEAWVHFDTCSAYVGTPTVQHSQYRDTRQCQNMRGHRTLSSSVMLRAVIYNRTYRSCRDAASEGSADT